jgi:hypothetical protein
MAIDPTRWDREARHWDFDWSSWSSDFHSSAIFSEPPFTSREDVLDRLLPIDFKLLRQITESNMPRKQNLLAERFDPPLKAYTLTRRLQFLNENVIDHYTLNFDRTNYRIFDHYWISGKSSREFAYHLWHYCNENPFPWGGRVLLKENGFIIDSPFPAGHSTEFMRFLWNGGINPEVYLFDIPNSAYYAFYEEAFDQSTKSWKKSEKYMIEDVWLGNLKKSKDKWSTIY